jgi:hypothetical protein
MIAAGTALIGAAALTVGIRATVAVADARARSGGWPVWRCGIAVVGLVVHDLVVGLVLLGLLAALPTETAAGAAFFGSSGTGSSGAVWVVLAGLIATTMLTPLLLDRRRAARPVRLARRLRFAGEPRLSRRDLLLQAIERRSVRATSEWLAARAEVCRRRTAATPELLLPAVWPPVRQVLRETAGVRRTDLSLLLQQAQTVADDAAPAQERLLTLLQLVYDRAGRSGVRRVLDQARRAPLRHGRSGAPAWGLGASAAPRKTIQLRPDARDVIALPDTDTAGDRPVRGRRAASTTTAPSPRPQPPAVIM